MNRTYIAIAVAVVIMLAVGSAQTSKPQLAAGPVGRYQLLYGEHHVADLGASGGDGDDKVILRIDTMTGRTSEWFNGRNKDGSFTSWWSPISEKP